MSRWTLLLGGLVVWAAHFFLVYAFALIFPGTQLAVILTWVATVPALAADAALLWMAAGRTVTAGGDDLDRWVLNVGGIAAGLSALAVLWQSLPALFA